MKINPYMLVGLTCISVIVIMILFVILGNHDQSGDYISWLSKRDAVYSLPLMMAIGLISETLMHIPKQCLLFNEGTVPGGDCP